MNYCIRGCYSRPKDHDGNQRQMSDTVRAMPYRRSYPPVDLVTLY